MKVLDGKHSFGILHDKMLPEINTYLVIVEIYLSLPNLNNF